MSGEETAKVENASADHSYFTISPRIVWALCRSPFDFTLWQTVKDIAGDSKECYISTVDLATLSMMSVGQVDISRKYLLSVKLLEGEVRRDPGYQLPVWHLRVPDLWEKSTEWSIEHRSIRSRIDFKRQQQDEYKALRAKVKEANRSLGEGGYSPGEKPIIPGEKTTSPSETKKIKKEEPKAYLCAGAQTPLDSRTAECSIEVKDFPSFSISEDLPDHIEVPAKCITTPEKKGDMMDGFLAYSRQASDPAHALQARIAEYPADVQNTLKILVDLYGWTAGSIPVRPKGRESGKYGQWIHEIREIDLIISGYGKTALEASVGPCAKLSISHPGAITWCLPGEVGKLAKIKARPSAIVDTPLTRHLETFTPRTPTKTI